MLEFYPEWERSDDGEAMRGAAQYLLLDGVPEDLRSQGVILRLGELARKFPTDFLSPPRNRAQRVGPAHPRGLLQPP